MGRGVRRPVDLAKLREFKNNVVKRLTSGTGQLAKARKIQYLQGLAEIVDGHKLRVKPIGGGPDVEIQFEHAILATGSTPAIPAALKVEDPRVMDSTAALDLPDVPKSLLVVGGGCHRARASAPSTPRSAARSPSSR
jgi:dihydrolipoamide dehydrogenase